MGRRVRDARLETREARRRLKPQKKPYWRLIVPGRHLGYYRGTKSGAWVIRLRKDGTYVERVIGTADDTFDANGRDILSYAQAHALTGSFTGEPEPEPEAPYLVADVMADYLSWYAIHRKALKATRYAVEAHILPKLGRIPIAELTKEKIRKWHGALATSEPRVRSGLGAPKRSRETKDQRARKATANRILTILKAALNHALGEGKVASDDAWRSVKPFRHVDAPKIRYLSEAECVRLLNACPPDFRPLVRGGLLTGCRYARSSACGVATSIPMRAAYMFATRKPRRVMCL